MSTVDGRELEEREMDPAQDHLGSVTTVGLHIVDILGRHVDHIPDGQGVALIE